MINLKILSDIDCDVYVDNNWMTKTEKDKISIIQLERGEYWLQFIGNYYSDCKIEYTLNLESHKLCKSCSNYAYSLR